MKKWRKNIDTHTGHQIVKQRRGLSYRSFEVNRISRGSQALVTLVVCCPADRKLSI